MTIYYPKSHWENMSPNDLDDFVELIFQHYRKKGFPYHSVRNDWREAEFQKWIKNEHFFWDKNEKKLTQSMSGLGLCWSFFPHSFGVKCGGKKLTPLDLFFDDKLLKKVIKKRLQMGDYMNDVGLRKTLRIYSGVQAVSNFRPTSACTIYSLFNCAGKVVWDMSGGYGGRCLGAFAARVGTYIATEPCKASFDGLQSLAKFCTKNQSYDLFLPPTKYELHLLGSEDFLPEPESLDFAFTSPPYYNTEKYSDEETQSWKKFPTKKEWLNEFLKKTMENCWVGLKPNCFMLINIANVKSYKNLEEDTIRIAKEIGFLHTDTYHYSLSSMPSNDDAYKYEPVFIFQKSK